MTPYRLVRQLLEVLHVHRMYIGVGGNTYLTRWFLYGGPDSGGRKVMLHYFHRSDDERALHDHPWPFVSLVLWPGHFEVTSHAWEPFDAIYYGPLSILRRKAEWKHRVLLEDGRPCWTLVFVGRKVRGWGFWCPTGFKPWRRFDRRIQAGLDGCGEAE